MVVDGDLMVVDSDFMVVDGDSSRIVCIQRGSRSSRQGEFHPKPLTEPYLTVSRHTALIILLFLKPASSFGYS